MDKGINQLSNKDNSPQDMDNKDNSNNNIVTIMTMIVVEIANVMIVENAVGIARDAAIASAQNVDVIV